MVILKIDDKDYPEILRKISNPPKEIYVEGNIENLHKPGIAIVGSRNCSEYGIRMCKFFTKSLVEYNVNIISGMAIGIDTVAHNTAIESLGTTIAVLPSGLNNVYPEENFELFRKIIDSGGTVVSEYLPEVEADKEKFKKRNRIVSGLAIGTLIVEGAYRSGTLVTANFTKKAKRPLFCISNTLDSKNGYVASKLIKEGAFLVTNEQDILNKFKNIDFIKKELERVEKQGCKKISFKQYDAKQSVKNMNTNNKNVSKDINKNIRKNISKDTSKNIIKNISRELIDIYNVISSDAIDINQICKITGKNINEVNYKLTMLEIDGFVEELPGRRFIRNV